MKILEYVGCPRDGVGCFGPREQWYLFYVPIKFYPILIIVSFIISLITFFILYSINKKVKKDLIISGIVFIVLLILEIIFMIFLQSMIIY